jgi:hypothetical protein
MASQQGAEDKKPVCGIVMPISTIEGCTQEHWSEVLEIISHGVLAAGFDPNLVSNAEDVGIIQKRIIQNLYDNPVVVCDVSAKNPNVMFELGMRLAFDKPTIIVKDDKTSYSFDTSPIEHLEYPRDLRFAKIVEFKSKLAEKIKATHDRSSRDDGFTTFLKHFGEFKVAKLEKKEVSGQEFILEELRNMRAVMSRLEQSIPRQTLMGRGPATMTAELELEPPVDRHRAKSITKLIESTPGVIATGFRDIDAECPKVVIHCDRTLDLDKLMQGIGRVKNVMLVDGRTLPS